MLLPDFSCHSRVGWESWDIVLYDWEEGGFFRHPNLLVFKDGSNQAQVEALLLNVLVIDASIPYIILVVE
jgi:hypothetical protein